MQPTYNNKNIKRCNTKTLLKMMKEIEESEEFDVIAYREILNEIFNGRDGQRFMNLDKDDDKNCKKLQKEIMNKYYYFHFVNPEGTLESCLAINDMCNSMCD
jgi:endonuclease/exonuclease/phosphatase family metal-dependent hydrolase